MNDGINQRSKLILEAIIEDYIATAEPVGSRTLSRRHVALSPATIRNVMADLEEQGFLASPHTSAGRIPTEKAYRFYVDALLELRGMSREEREQIRQRFSGASHDVQQVLRQTSRLLSSISHYMGIVAAPRLTAHVFRQIEFVPLSGNRVLAILVSQNGTVQNRLIELDRPASGDDLVRMANYLNRMLTGLTIAAVRQRIVTEMASDKSRYDELLQRALELSRQTIDEETPEVFIDGQVNILEQPEFADVGKMRDIFRAFEEKGELLDLLDRCMNAQGVQIFIGSETRLQPMAGMSLITSTYATGSTVGVLGVIGPTRMGYSRVIPIVDYTARLVSKMLDVK